MLIFMVLNQFWDLDLGTLGVTLYPSKQVPYFLASSIEVVQNEKGRGGIIVLGIMYC